MRRLLTCWLGAALLAFTFTAAPIAGAAPERPSHAVSSADTYAICLWMRNATGRQSLIITNWRTIHYGTAHVTQCQYDSDIAFYRECWQHVWGNPRFYLYKTGTGVTGCW